MIIYIQLTDFQDMFFSDSQLSKGQMEWGSLRLEDGGGCSMVSISLVVSVLVSTVYHHVFNELGIWFISSFPLLEIRIPRNPKLKN